MTTCTSQRACAGSSPAQSVNGDLPPDRASRGAYLSPPLLGEQSALADNPNRRHSRARRRTTQTKLEFSAERIGGLHIPPAWIENGGLLSGPLRHVVGMALRIASFLIVANVFGFLTREWAGTPARHPNALRRPCNPDCSNRSAGRRRFDDRFLDCSENLYFAMEHNSLGKTGLNISRLSFGASSLRATSPGQVNWRRPWRCVPSWTAVSTNSTRRPCTTARKRFFIGYETPIFAKGQKP